MVTLATFPYFEFCVGKWINERFRRHVMNDYNSVGFILFAYVLENYLSLRQHSRYKLKQVPSELKTIIDDEKFIKSQNYHADKR